MKQPKAQPLPPLPVTVCEACGGRWDHPRKYLDHLPCNPAWRKPQIIEALRGLLDAAPQKDGKL